MYSRRGFTPSDRPPPTSGASGDPREFWSSLVKIALKTTSTRQDTTRRDKMASRRLPEAFKTRFEANLDPTWTPREPKNLDFH